MHKLVTRTHPVLFICALLAGLTAVSYFPHLYPEQLLEIPMAALIFGEVGLALLLTLLFYEHASSQHIVRLSCTVLAFTMLIGSAGNFAGGYMGLQPQFLPDAFVLISWVQLAIMNVTGLLATLTLFKLRSPEHLVMADRPLKGTQDGTVPLEPLRRQSAGGPETEDFSPPPAPQPDVPEVVPADKGERPESVKEILESLDISRINRLERSLHPEAVSLESLFKEETEAARTAKSGEAPDQAAASQPIGLPAKSEAKPEPRSLFALPKIDAIPGVDAIPLIEEKKPPEQEEEIISLPAPPEEIELPPPPEPAAPTATSDLKSTSKLPSVKPEAEESVPATDKSLVSQTLAGQGSPTDIAKTVRGLKLSGEQMPIAASSKPADSPPAAQSTPAPSTASGAKDSEDDLTALLRGLKEEVVSSPREADTKKSDAPVSRFQQLLSGEALTEPLEDISFGAAPDTVLDKPQPSPAPSKTVKPEPAKAPSAAAKSSSSDSVLGDVGSELDDIFANMVTAEQKEFSAEALSGLREKKTEEDDESPEVRLSSAEATEVKEFGRLSATASKGTEDGEQTGTMKSIGKMLLDSQAVENIIKQGESRGFRLSTARVLTAAQGEDLQSILTKISGYPGIAGSMIIGHDGLVMASTMQTELDRDVAAAMSMAIYGNSNMAASKLEMGSLSQMVLQSKNKFTILTEVGEGVLAVFTNHRQINRLNATIGAILKSIRGEPLPDISDLPEEEPQEEETEELVLSAAPPKAPEKAKPVETAKPAAKEVEEMIELSASPKDKTPPLPVIEDEDEEEAVTTASPTKPITAGTALFSVKEDSVESQLTTQQRNAIATSQVHDLLAELEASQQLPAIKPDQPVKAETETVKPAPEKAKPAAKDVDFDEVVAMPAAPAAAAKPSAASPSAAKEQPEEAASTAAMSLPSSEAKEVKEFGRLSAASGFASMDGTDGTMKTIGKMLIDVQAVGNIIKAGEDHARGLTTARVISAARGEGIRSLLAQIDHSPGVVGSLIVGHDGLVIASTLGATMDKDVLGAMTSSLHSNTNLATNKLDLGRLRQMVLQSPEKMTIFTEVEVGVLAVFVENRELDKLDEIMQAIDHTISG